MGNFFVRREDLLRLVFQRLRIHGIVYKRKMGIQRWRTYMTSKP
ncbi:hypothetical protein [Brevibacillus sp. MER 51]|nr:hypothetical protein [Brevibacillus sp. MER 51]